MVQAQDGYYVGHCADGRALAFTLSSMSRNPAIHLELEGMEPGHLDFLTNSNHGSEFTGAGDEGDTRQQISRLWLATATPPTKASGYLFLKPRTNALPFSAERVARQASFSRRRGAHIWGRGGGKEFTATWPRFEDGLPFHKLLSNQLAAEAHTEAAKFTAGADDLMWDGLKHGGASYDWEGSLDTHIVWLGTNLVSLFQLHYEFTGGAHGNSAAIGRNFILTGSKAREFTLKELFLPGTDWESVLSAACMRDLQRQHASWVLPDAEPKIRIKGFTAADMAAFTVDQYGLTIFFNPYAVGSYAEGMFQVIVPWEELKQFLDPKVRPNQRY